MLLASRCLTRVWGQWAGIGSRLRDCNATWRGLGNLSLVRAGGRWRGVAGIACCAGSPNTRQGCIERACARLCGLKHGLGRTGQQTVVSPCTVPYCWHLGVAGWV